MTDRYSGFVVTLAEDIREDDAERIVTALRMVKGVLEVEPIPRSCTMTDAISAHAIETRVRIQVRDELWDIADRLRKVRGS